MLGSHCCFMGFARKLRRAASLLCPQVVRLAHKYDAPSVLKAAESWLTTPDAAQDPKQVTLSEQGLPASVSYN